MHIKKMLSKIIESQNTEAMNWLGDVFSDLIYELEEMNPMWFKSIEYKMHVLAYGENLTEAEAIEWVSRMRNKDGTVGEHWTMNQTTEILKSKGFKYNPYDFYAVMNMIYSDYFNPKFDIETYVELTKDWLDDVDIGNCKTLKYYIYIATANPCTK